MKTKYTLNVNGIKAELDFSYDLDAKKDSEFIKRQLEEQIKLLNSIDRQKICEEEPEIDDTLTEAVENLFLDSIKELAKEFNSKNKNNFSLKL